MATAVATAAASGAVSSAGKRARAATAKIDWSSYNWPTAGEPFNLLHVDFEELKAKRGEGVWAPNLLLYRWWLATMVLYVLNFINAIILSATYSDDGIFDGINVLYSFFDICIGTGLGTLAWHSIYQWSADGGWVNKIYGFGALAVLLVFNAVLVIGAFGHVNGFANLGSERLDAAKKADDGVAGYWMAMVVIESLGWVATIVVAVYGGYSAYVVD